MAKQLTLVRHAKSSWKDPYLLDLERPLNKRGERDAPLMGERLAERVLTPDLIVSSPAVRALATAEIVAQALEYPVDEIVIDERIYGADVAEWLDIIRRLDDGLDHVICFGHNPGLTDLVNYLSPRAIENVPTCGVVELAFDADAWAHVGHIEPDLVYFDYPKRGTSPVQQPDDDVQQNRQHDAEDD